MTLFLFMGAAVCEEGAGSCTLFVFLWNPLLILAGIRSATLLFHVLFLCNNSKWFIRLHEALGLFSRVDLHVFTGDLEGKNFWRSALQSTVYDQLYQSSPGVGVSDLTTRELSVVLMMGKWLRGEVWRSGFLHCRSHYNCTKVLHYQNFCGAYFHSILGNHVIHVNPLYDIVYREMSMVSHYM